MTDPNISLIRRWFEEVWNQGKLSTIDELSCPHGVGRGQVEHTTELTTPQFRAFVQALREGFPDIHVTIQDSFGSGDRVVARWTARMTHRNAFMGIPATHQEVSVSGISIQRIVSGKIVEAWDCWDQLALLNQIGALPKPSFVGAAVAGQAPGNSA